MTGYCADCGNQICICDEIEVAKKATPENPPAFPHLRIGETHGMTLRDYFAGQALIAYATHDSRHAGLNAALAYCQADEMLKVRAQAND